MADVPLPLSFPPEPASRRPWVRIEAASQRTRIALVCAVRAVGNWRGAIGGTIEDREDAPGDGQSGRSIAAVRIWERINRLDDSQRARQCLLKLFNFLKA
jgi:hypothetical protein